jgi:tetratricopeptide (TPR) repeat protein
MKIINKIVLLLIITIFLLKVDTLLAQNAIIKETLQEFLTYPFSDPDPVPDIGRIYPYFRFDGYAHHGQSRQWKMVTMENPYIKVFITPEIGGKIWGAFEKVSGKAFIYFNHVVKFRDIAMRGPWTSGGIESNFGTIGHAPTCSSPVDYLLQENNDGSVSCIIGAMDLPSRTVWRVTIRLPKDKAYFETAVIWHNPTAINQSYYHWMNGAAKADGNLQFFYPGNNFIGHDGRAHSWPLNQDGRDLSFYENNNFGSYKSYHILQEYTDYFGGYWHDDQFGFGNWSLYTDKPGKKLWIWGLSRQGMIWENLLTDKDGQYIEMQSGRLFNQAGGSSSETPFKHRTFVPNSTDSWNEIWFPVKETNGMAAVSPYGVLNIERLNSRLNFYLCPLQKINDELSVEINGEKVYSKFIRSEPLKIFIDSMCVDKSDITVVSLGNNKIRYTSTDREDRMLHRPLEKIDGFNWQSVQGLAMRAEELAKQRNFDSALENYYKCLEKDPDYLDALNGLAELFYRQMDDEKALQYAKRSLAIDTYNDNANFIYGVINRRCGDRADAKDGFSIAAHSMQYRSAAYTQLAEMYAEESFWIRVEEYARRALDYNKFNLNARQVLAVCHRKMDRQSEAKNTLDDLLQIDPLNHFARFEQYLLNNTIKAKNKFQKMIRSELPHETYLELALTYYNIALVEEAVEVLQLAPENPVVDYWRAYLYDFMGEKANSIKSLKKAEEQSPYLIFPFRPETAELLKWAGQKSNHWKNKYYLALVYWNNGKREKASDLLSSCGDTPDYAPFYLTRARIGKLKDISLSITDCKRAIQLDKSEWRAWLMLSRLYQSTGDQQAALTTLGTIFQRYPEDYRLAVPYANALYELEKYSECLTVLDKADVLPFEGAGGSRTLYHRAQLMSAIQEFEKDKLTNALGHIQKARLWPENLGAGKPYDVDERMEDYVEMVIWGRLEQKQKSDSLLAKIESQTAQYRMDAGTNHLIGALALKKRGNNEAALSLLNDWATGSDNKELTAWVITLFKGQNIPAEPLSEKVKYNPENRLIVKILEISKLK